MHEEWFATMQDLYRPRPAEVQTVKDYIEGLTSADTAAKSSTSSIAKENEPDPRFIWHLLKAIAIDLPNTQDQVVELLAAIKRLPDPIRNGKSFEISGMKVFSQLAYFHGDLNSYYTVLAVPPRHADDPARRQEFATVNAFYARLTAKGVVDLGFALFRLIEVLLQEKNMKERRLREFFLPAAANQLIYAAPRLSNLRRTFGRHRERYPHLIPWMNPIAMWDDWKAKFGKFSTSEEVSMGTRDLLTRAIRVMEEIDQ